MFYMYYMYTYVYIYVYVYIYIIMCLHELQFKRDQQLFMWLEVSLLASTSINCELW